MCVRPKMGLAAPKQASHNDERQPEKPLRDHVHRDLSTWAYVILITALYSLVYTHSSLCKAQSLPTYDIPSLSRGSSQVSILIASPSADAVYTLYGHAGLRMQDSLHGVDITFNWGIFDFDEPNFIGRFVEGRTDYLVKAVPTADYMYEYYSRGSSVTEMTINLSNEEKAKLWHYLLWNIRPENSRYRYSFFYDNCSNRVVKVLIETMGGKLVLPKVETQTLREIINHAEACMPWLVLGTDLTVASPADRPADEYTQLFLPERVAALLPDAYVQMPDGTRRPFVHQVYIHHSPDEDRVVAQLAERPIRTALWLSVLWCLVLTTLTILDIRADRSNTWLRFLTTSIESITLILSGLVGCLLFYLAFISEHPAMWPNYNMLILHPLHLILGLPLGLRTLHQGRKKALLRTIRRWYHFATFVASVGFVLMGWALPQHFNAVMYGLAVALGLISAHRLWIFQKEDVQCRPQEN